MKISKTFELSTGHRLSNYKGKCRHLHGHNYLGELIITDADNGLDELGMLIDYDEVKQIINDTVDKLFDHKTVLKKGDPFNEEIHAVCVKYEGEDTSTVMVDYNPTVENLIQHMHEMLVLALCERYPNKLFQVNLKLSETGPKGASNCEL